MQPKAMHIPPALLIVSFIPSPICQGFSPITIPGDHISEELLHKYKYIASRSCEGVWEKNTNSTLTG